MFQRLDGTLALVDGAVGAEIIDLETGIARVAVATDDLPRTVSGGTSVALQDGRVLIIGGRVLGPEGGASPPTSTGETILIDLEAGAAVAGPTLNTPRFAHVSVTLPDATVLVFGGANIQDGAFVGFGTAVEQLFDLPAVLPVLPTPPDTAPPPPPPAQQFFLGPGFNLTGWLGATSVEDATAAIAGQFDSIFRWDAATRTFAAFQAAGPAFLNDLDELVFGDALWVFVSDPAGAVWEQPRFTEARDVDLLAGFNMVLWTGPDGAPVEDALAGIAAGLIGAFIWDQATQSFRTFAPDAPSFVNTADVLTYGAGLWLQIRAATTWSQPASAP